MLLPKVNVDTTGLNNSSFRYKNRRVVIGVGEWQTSRAWIRVAFGTCLHMWSAYRISIYGFLL